MPGTMSPPPTELHRLVQEQVNQGRNVKKASITCTQIITTEDLLPLTLV